MEQLLLETIPPAKPHAATAPRYFVLSTWSQSMASNSINHASPKLSLFNGFPVKIIQHDQ
jgi:hypothetical protein